MIFLRRENGLSIFYLQAQSHNSLHSFGLDLFTCNFLSGFLSWIKYETTINSKIMGETTIRIKQRKSFTYYLSMRQCGCMSIQYFSLSFFISFVLFEFVCLCFCLSWYSQSLLHALVFHSSRSRILCRAKIIRLSRVLFKMMWNNTCNSSTCTAHRVNASMKPNSWEYHTLTGGWHNLLSFLSYKNIAIS